MTSEFVKRLHYGWVIVAVSTLALIISNGLAIGGMPVFSKAIREEFISIGVISPDRAESFLANGANITFLMSGLFSMVGGWLIERLHLKRLMIFGCICLGGGLLVHSQAHSWEMVYLSRFLMGVSLGFVGVAPNVVIVANWFRESRGTAVGILLTGTSIGGFLIPIVAAPLITAYGWRSALIVVSLFVWLILLPAIILLIKDPERKRSAETAEADTPAIGFTLSQAVRTPVFWVFGLCAAAVFYPIFATTQQFILYLQSPKIGLSLQTAAFAQSALFAVSVGGKSLAGFLSDRVSPDRTMLAFGAVMFASTLVLLDLSASNALLFLIPFGLGYGGIFVMLQRMAADLFGLREYGKILGTLTLIEITGAAIGGRTTGYLADLDGGDYTSAFYGVIVAAAVALVCAVLLNTVLKQADRERQEN
jgi:MFS family permease